MSQSSTAGCGMLWIGSIKHIIVVSAGSSYPRVSQGEGGPAGALCLGAGHRAALWSPEEILLLRSCSLSALPSFP